MCLSHSFSQHNNKVPLLSSHLLIFTHDYCKISNVVGQPQIVVGIVSLTSCSLLCVPALNMATFRGPSLLSCFLVDCARKPLAPFLQGVQPLPETQSQLPQGISHYFYLSLGLLDGHFSLNMTELQPSETTHSNHRSKIASLCLTHTPISSHSCPLKNTYYPSSLIEIKIL